MHGSMAPTKGRYPLKGGKGRPPGTRRGLRSQQRDPSVHGITDIAGTVEAEGDKEGESIEAIDGGGPDLVQQTAIPVTRSQPIRPSAEVLSLDAQLGGRTTCTMAPIVEVSDITMPPSSIYLVGFGDEYSCDHIDIPQGVKHGYVSLLPHVKAVNEIILFCFLFVLNYIYPFLSSYTITCKTTTNLLFHTGECRYSSHTPTSNCWSDINSDGAVT